MTPIKLMTRNCMTAFALPLTLLLVLSLTVPAAHAQQKPDEIVKEAVDRVRGLIEENAETYRSDPNAFYKMVDEEIVPNFDMPYITRLVLARHAREASNEQRRRFAVAFKNMLVRTYADAMLEYNDAVQTEWAPLRMAADADQATVQSRLLREDGPPIPIGFVMHKVDAGWKIYDITVEGLSLVTNFRAQFNQEIRANGLDALIQKMESRDFKPELEG